MISQGPNILPQEAYYHTPVQDITQPPHQAPMGSLGGPITTPITYSLYIYTLTPPPGTRERVHFVVRLFFDV